MRNFLVAISLAFLTTFFISGSALAGPKTFADIAAKPDKAVKKVWFGPAHADMNKVGKIGLPKRVGLISFYLFDVGSFKFNAMAATYGPKYRNTATGHVTANATKTYGITDKEANVFASQFAEKAVPSLKVLFEEQGMELLTPSEFIDSEEKRQAYVDFKLPKTGYQKFTEGALNFLDKNPHANAAADGFLMIPTHIFSGDREQLRVLDELRKSLDLDAFIVIANNSNTTKKSVNYTGSQMLFYGPNPEPLPTHKLKAKYWTPMIPYPSGTYGKGFKGLSIGKVKGSSDILGSTIEIEAIADFEGYEVVIESIAKKSFEKLQKALSKTKPKK